MLAAASLAGNCIKGGSEGTLRSGDWIFLSDKDSASPGCQDPRMSYGNDDTQTTRNHFFLLR